MANHKSALKRVRANETKKARNKYYHKTTRNAIRDIRALTDKKAAEGAISDVFSMIDKLAKTNVIHKNKAANLKSGIAKRVAAL
jgi:small subunit ribosomal protein S20